MSTEDLPHTKAGLKQWTRARPWFLAAALGAAALFAWGTRPDNPGIGAYDLSREDGKSRFYATTYAKLQKPPNLTLAQQVVWTWMQFQRRYRRRNPAAYTFRASPVQPCSILGLLNQCTDVSGTQYLVAVEIAGTVEFGHTNMLNGTQRVAGFEHALETSDGVLCYDWGKKRNFRDTLLVIREKPRVVKVLPRSKLAEYQKLGLVKTQL